MTDHYAKHCQIEAITPQDISPIADFIAKSTIHQMSLMCVDYLTEQLAQVYMKKYEIVMEGKDRESLQRQAKDMCAIYLMEVSASIKNNRNSL